MKSKAMFSMALVLAAVLTVPMVMAQPNRRMADPNMVAQKLNLSPEQEAQFLKIEYDFAQAQIDRRAKMQKAKLSLRQLMNTSSPDLNVCQPLINTISSLTGEATKALLEKNLKVRQLLDDDQYKIYQRSTRARMRRGKHEGSGDKSRRGGLGKGAGRE